ncbi:MAG: hypothetical protein V4819_03220 [Verrucomicrobiota bacterium]
MFATWVDARSRKYALNVEMVNLGRFVQLYQQEKGGYPESWDEMEVMYPKLKETFSMIQPSKRLSLMPGRLELPGRMVGATVLFISRDPLIRPGSWRIPFLKRPDWDAGPCYALLIEQDGGVGLRYLPAAQVAAIFASAGRPLPQPSGLGSFQHEKDYRFNEAVFWLLAGGLPVFVLWKVIRRIRSRGGAATK